MHRLIDREKQRLAKRYRRDNRIINMGSYLVSAILVLILLYFNVSKNFVGFLKGISEVRFFVILLYFATLHVVYSVISFPFTYLGSYTIEHKYGFSTQNMRTWSLDWLKSFFVGFILGLIIFEALYLITDVAPSLWWFWLSLMMIGFSVILTNLFPVLILPLFYKTSPIENEELKKKIEEMCDRTEIYIQGVFSINLSSKSTKANAAVIGLGNTKRIVLGDTFVSDYSEEEILTVLAHEITHYQKHHIWRLILWQSLITLALFYIFSIIHPFFYELIGFEKISEIAAFPLFACIFVIISFIIKPLGSSISRFYERRADKGALDLTGDPESFVNVMAKFCNKQLSIAYPNPLIEWYKYSHPSPGNRIAFAEDWQKNQAQ